MRNNTYDELIDKLNDELDLLKTQSLNVIFLIEKAIWLCEHVMLKMREMAIKNGFKNTDMKIYFFKKVKPQVNSKLIF